MTNDRTRETLASRASPSHPAVRALEDHRAALTGHCYRMLGSASEADDAVQETMIRAWRALDRFEERAALKTWLFRIATNVCLDALSERTRRGRPIEIGPAGTVHDVLTTRGAESWVEPIPEAHVVPSDADPMEIASMRQSIRLAFVAALQHLPPKQRAVLLLTEVLGWAATEVAESLETSVASVNSALQRARATLSARDLSDLHAPPPSNVALVDRFVEAFERYDMDALTQLLREDATTSMPPFELWLQGHEPIREWMLGPGAGCRGSKLTPIAASGSPSFAQYKPSDEGDGRMVAWAIVVLELDGDRIAAMNYFLDVQALFPRWGLPLEL